MKFQKILMIGFEEGNLGAHEWERIKELSESHVIVPKDSGTISDELIDADAVRQRSSTLLYLSDGLPILSFNITVSSSC